MLYLKAKRQREKSTNVVFVERLMVKKNAHNCVLKGKGTRPYKYTNISTSSLCEILKLCFEPTCVPSSKSNISSSYVTELSIQH